MARNVEIKARVHDPERLQALAQSLADEGPIEIVQRDTFFCCPRGRLKLRELSPEHGQLIFYRRDDTPGPKESTYLISTTSSPGTLRDTLAAALGVAGQVSKRRLLFVAGRIRIHLDQVDELGAFVELEVVLEDGESVEDGKATALDVMRRLGIVESQLVEGAYVDMLAAKEN